ncbi:MAG: hypothetical protein LWW94_11070 [Candidatus Desulfofervidaceae bacterium]|nr:hypothetical protein [Candidatus Desulfofervidaceae bacterium]
MQADIREASTLVKSIFQAIAHQAEDIARLEAKLKTLEDVLCVVAFWGALACELIKARSFITMPQDQHSMFMEKWQKAHEVADRRVEDLLGHRVWKQKFDPTKLPKEG